MEKRKLSPSSINTHKQCPRKYYYQYVEELPTKPSIHLKMGSIVHKCLEEFFGRRHNLTEDYSKNLTQAMIILLESYFDIKEFNYSQEEEKKHFNVAQKMLRNFTVRFCNQMDMLMESGKAKDISHAFNLLKPKLREKYYSDEELNVHGYVDSVEKDFDGNITLIDYKTSMKYKNILSPDYKRQMAIYALLFNKAEGTAPHLVGVHYLKFGEVFFIEVTPSMLEWAKEEILDVSEKTKSTSIGDYGKIPQTLCKWCDFYDICTKSS